MSSSWHSRWSRTCSYPSPGNRHRASSQYTTDRAESTRTRCSRVSHVSIAASISEAGHQRVSNPSPTSGGRLPPMKTAVCRNVAKGNGIGPGPHPHRDAGAGHSHADHDLRQVAAGVLALAPGPEPGSGRPFPLTVVVAGRLGRAGAGAGLLAAGPDLTAGVAGHRLIGGVGLEVGAGGVEEQQV